MLRVAVIGGGPAGLATLKFLKTAHKYFGGEPVNVTLFEASEEIGGTFVNKIYEDVEVSISISLCLELTITLLSPCSSLVWHH